MVLADTTLTFDPAWPWSLPGFGPTALAGVAIVLALLTIWTYLGARGSNLRRLFVMLCLRLGALLVACFLVLRPSLAEQDDENALPSKLLILIDKSASMNNRDEFNNLSRWDNARRILFEAPAVVSGLKRLSAEQRVEVVQYQGAEDVNKLDPKGQADGKRTDMGEWLHKLAALHGKDTNLRGLVMFTDGADNGTRYPTMEEAGVWRSICPLYIFGLGSATTTSRRNDIAFIPNKIIVEPNPAHVKGKMTVKGFANAPGFENSKVELSVLIDGKLAAPVQHIVLRKTNENEVKIECDAPPTPGEIKVTLKIKPMEGELTTANNEISTFATVIKQGVSILWVDGRLRLESTFAIRAILPDKRFRIDHTKRLNEAKPSKVATDWYQFDKHKYDVIVIGDISASRFSGGDPRVFERIRKLVEEDGTGLLMVGGKETFANSDWQGTPVAALLPVELNAPGQIDAPVRVQPLGSEYLVRLANDPAMDAKIWGTFFDKLDGITRLGHVKSTSVLLAKAEGSGDPVLAYTQHVKGRILAFAGDTTFRAWTKNKEAVAAYQRFWRQVMLWLAHQEEAEGSIRVLPDVRRVSADTQAGLGFTLEKIDKGGLPDKNAKFKVRVIGPNTDEEVQTSKEAGKERGYVQHIREPGEYRIIASAGDKEKPGEAKFLVFAEDLENLRPAADHDFLRKLAQAARGKFYLADEKRFADLLNELRAQQIDASKPKLQLWPDWRRNPASDSLGDQLETLWNSTALAAFLVFSTLLCIEWYLRRRWGMV